MRQVTNRIMRRARRAKPFVRGELGARRLSQAVPEIANYRRLIQSETGHLRDVYEQYISSISTGDMAVSWEAACFLFILAKHRQAKRILDLGSGFSSYVLRCYAAQAPQPVYVCSVDDNDAWLAKTERFLTAQRLSTDALMRWDDFKQTAPEPFDLVFHDLGSMETRKESLPFVLRLVAPQGLIVLDDMHKPHYKDVAIIEARRAGVSLHSARKFTLDRFGRFSEFVLAGPTGCPA